MVINKVEIKDDSPFSETLLVRDSWAKMVSDIGNLIYVFREVISQNDDWISVINTMFVIKNSLLDGKNELKENGSNDEKMSGIMIKIWWNIILNFEGL